jgi:hypothetical protein
MLHFPVSYYFISKSKSISKIDLSSHELLHALHGEANAALCITYALKSLINNNNNNSILYFYVLHQQLKGQLQTQHKYTFKKLQPQLLQQ